MKNEKSEKVKNGKIKNGNFFQKNEKMKIAQRETLRLLLRRRCVMG